MLLISPTTLEPSITVCLYVSCILLLTCRLFLIPAWSRLPVPFRGASVTGINVRKTCCTGCNQPLSRHAPQFICRFHSTGFPFRPSLGTEAGTASPCYTRYHLHCVRAGAPFRTRLRHNAGLSMPPLADFPGFICELCTVRSVVNRELYHRPSDLALLALERMRMIDMINSWAEGTHKAYQSKIKVIRAFEGAFGVPVLRNTPITRPPASPAIALMWVQEHYSLRPSTRRHDGKTDEQITFTTVRGLRSAASMFCRLDLQTAFPGASILDRAQRAIAVRHCSPTDELCYSLMNRGMATRLGEDSIPAHELLATQVRYLDASLEERFHGPLTSAHRLEIARAGFTNANLWCAWLRAGENFGLRYCDIRCTHPRDGPSRGIGPWYWLPGGAPQPSN